MSEQTLKKSSEVKASDLQERISSQIKLLADSIDRILALRQMTSTPHAK